MDRTSPRVECVWPAGALLGEGAFWDTQDAAVYWVDIKAPAVHRFTPSNGERKSWPMPEPDAPTNRFNDGTCDMQGRFWVGSMDDEERRHTGWLYRLDATRQWVRTDGPYICTNGPAFLADGKRMYHTDTVGRVIYAFDIDANGMPSGKQAHIRFAEDDGYPDGMTVDAVGHLWVAHWGGWSVTQFYPDGSVQRVVPLPVAQVTKCAFGGPGLDTLYITTASIGLDEAERNRQPLAGGLFACPIGIRGTPAGSYAG